MLKIQPQIDAILDLLTDAGVAPAIVQRLSDRDGTGELDDLVRAALEAAVMAFTQLQYTCPDCVGGMRLIESTEPDHGEYKDVLTCDDCGNIVYVVRHGEPAA